MSIAAPASSPVLDKVDLKLLSLLQQEGRKTNLDLSTQVNLSPAACLRRIKALEESGVIAGYCAILDLQKLGYSLTVFVEIGLASENAQALDEFERAIRIVDEVQECHLMSGDKDYLLKIAVKNLEDYERIHRNVLANLPYVARIKSSFSIRRVAQQGNLLGQKRIVPS